MTFNSDLKRENSIENSLVVKAKARGLKASMAPPKSPWDIQIGRYRIEVKNDYKALETGNIAVETACNGKRSGISVSEADSWLYVLGEDVRVIGRSTLNYLAINHGRKVSGGDRVAATMYLLPVSVFKVHGMVFDVWLDRIKADI